MNLDAIYVMNIDWGVLLDAVLDILFVVGHLHPQSSDVEHVLHCLEYLYTGGAAIKRDSPG